MPNPKVSLVPDLERRGNADIECNAFSEHILIENRNFSSVPLHQRHMCKALPSRINQRRIRKSRSRLLSWNPVSYQPYRWCDTNAVIMFVVLLTISNHAKYFVSAQPSPVHSPTAKAPATYPYARQATNKPNGTFPVNSTAPAMQQSSSWPWGTPPPSDILTISPTTIPPTSDKPTTASPTIVPTDIPSLSPTVSPTRTESSPPTASFKPTTLTAEPTTSSEPSRSPSLAPSTVPITKRPTRAPTSQPTRKNQKETVNVITVLSDTAGKLEGFTPFDFEEVTGGHIKQSIENADGVGDLLDLLTVSVSIDKQEVIEFRRRIRNRRLQQLGPLEIAYTTLLTYQSSKTDFNTTKWIMEAFDSNTDRAAYIDRLQNRNPDFAYVTRIDVEVEGQTTDNAPSPSPIVDPEKPNGQDDNKMLWIIIGACAGGFVLLLALIFVLVRQRGDKTTTEQQSTINQTKPSAGTTTLVDVNSKMGYAAEINVDRQDDISTLGDPVFGGHVGAMMMDDAFQRDEYTASVAPDYDYSKHYLGQSGNASMGTNTMMLDDETGLRDRFESEGSNFNNRTNSVEQLDEDEAFEEQYSPADSPGKERFEVEVPPGKLGMVIDTPNNGVPVVHAIKQESILCDRVYVGDQLISVDGEDVTTMTAVQVSKLISLKSDQHRKLVFLRAKETLYPSPSMDSLEEE